MQALTFYLFSIVTLGSAMIVVSARNPVHAVFALILAFFGAAGLFILLGAEFLAMILVIVYVGAVAVMFLFVVMMLDIPIPQFKKWFVPHIHALLRAFKNFSIFSLLFGGTFALLLALGGYIAFVAGGGNPTFLLTTSGDQWLDLLWREFTASWFTWGLIILIAFALGRYVATLVLGEYFIGLLWRVYTYLPMGWVVAFILGGELISIMMWWSEPSPISEDLITRPIPPLQVMPNTHALGQLLYTDYFYVFQTSGLILLVAMIGAIVLTLRERRTAKQQNVREQISRSRDKAVSLKKVETGEGISL